MRRRELTKAIKKYAKMTNFKKYGLVRQFIKREQALIEHELETINAYNCPKCGSSNLNIDSTEDYYDADEWVVCEDCSHDFDLPDDFFEAYGELRNIPYCDDIMSRLYFVQDCDIDSHEWQLYCEKSINAYLNK